MSQTRITRLCCRSSSRSFNLEESDRSSIEKITLSGVLYTVYLTDEHHILAVRRQDGSIASCTHRRNYGDDGDDEDQDPVVVVVLNPNNIDIIEKWYEEQEHFTLWSQLK